MNNISYLIPIVNINNIIVNNLKINSTYNYINNDEINKWNIHKNMVLEIKQFKIKGILIYTNGIKKIFLRFYLDNIKQENYKFIIYNFFGKKIVEFVLNNNKFFLKENNKIINLKEYDKYLFEKKYKIPIKNLRSWLVGLPGDSKEFILNKIGRLEKIEYIDDSKKYIIKYNKYHNSINPALPTNIEFNQGNNFINIKINNWILS